MERSGDNIAMGSKALGDSKVNPTLVDIGNGNGSTAGLSCHCRGQETNGAGSENKSG